MMLRIGRGRRGGVAARVGVGALMFGLVVLLWWSPATAAPSEWTVVVSEKTGGADPLSEYGTNTMWYVTQHVMEPLLRIELLPDGKSWGVVNHLAERWSFPDEKTFVVTLKKGVKFQNGEELTAEHVKFAYDALVSAEKPTRTAVIVKPLGSCEIVDRYTVRWRLAAPGLSVLGSMEYMLIPPLARKGMTREQFEAKPIGTGPYRVVDWPRDGTVRLEAWDGFRSGKATPEKLVFRYVPEPSTRVFELTAGTAQIAETIPIEAVASIQANPRLQVTSLKGSLALSYVINLFKTTPPLRDKRVRQAMNYAVDREAIVKAILGGRGTALPGPLWPGHLGYTPDVTPYRYDPEKAKALLKEAGYPDGFSFKWTVTQGVVAKDIEIAQAVANQLAKVGIKATLQPSERARLLAERNEGGYDMTELVWTMAWNPAVLFQFTLLTSYPDAKLTQFGAPPDELVKARQLMKEGAAAPTIDQAGSTYARLNRLMHEDAFWLFVHTIDQLWGVQKDTGWRPYPVAFQQYNDYWAMMGRKAPENPDVPLIFK
jgi:peptide/nickel transport system substrate-binding protein